MATTTPMAILPSLSPKHLISLTPRYPSLSISHNSQNPPQISLKPSPVWRISAVSADSLPSEVNPIENTELVVSTGDDGVSNVISILLFIAFVGLSILTIGFLNGTSTEHVTVKLPALRGLRGSDERILQWMLVIYIAVTDFLQKREKERFEKEEEVNKKKKKGGKKVRARARAGPRGFGQKIEEDDED